jgi:hypothetical protein
VGSLAGSKMSGQVRARTLAKEWPNHRALTIGLSIMRRTWANSNQVTSRRAENVSDTSLLESGRDEVRVRGTIPVGDKGAAKIGRFVALCKPVRAGSGRCREQRAVLSRSKELLPAPEFAQTAHQPSIPHHLTSPTLKPQFKQDRFRAGSAVVDQ